MARAIPFHPRVAVRGMVTTADQLASSAGISMLEQGGTAADAIVAAAAAMAVVGPHLCGLGGDVLAMVKAPGAPPQALLAVGRAGSGADGDGLRRDGHRDMPLRGDVRSVSRSGRGRRMAGAARALRTPVVGDGAGTGHRAGRGRLRRLAAPGLRVTISWRMFPVRRNSVPAVRSSRGSSFACRASPAPCGAWHRRDGTASTAASSAGPSSSSAPVSTRPTT